jgi:FkbM family methyltransferase
MATNGEWMVQDVVLSSPQPDCLIAVDVGANVGDWSRRFLTAARQRGRTAQVHAFEPAAATFEALVANLIPAFEGSVVAVQRAASDHNGKGTLFKVHELAGSNSIHGSSGASLGMTPESIELCTLDDYCTSAGIETINLLKIDAEGHDHLVLSGARTLLERAAIEVVQFEYNHRWIGARRFLKDVFDDLSPLGYQIGKVTPQGIEWYSAWNAELETFREGNYLAVRQESRGRFVSIAWWRDA